MTIREVQALVALYRACTDPDLRRRVLRLVPELGDWDVDAPLHVRTFRVGNVSVFCGRGINPAAPINRTRRPN